MISASNCLSQKKQSVDELNIFPVPDGDTGTNMSMTLSAAARELKMRQMFSAAIPSSGRKNMPTA